MDLHDTTPSEGASLLPPLDSNAGPARRISALRASALIDAALDSAYGEPARRTSRRPNKVLVLIAACGVAASAFAFDAFWRRHHRGHDPGPSRVLRAAPVPSRSEPIVTTTSREPAPAASSVQVAPMAVPAILPVSSRPIASRVQTTRDAADLLRMANELRGRRRWREAEAAYRAVLRAAPGGDDAYAAAIAAASLDLEHLGNPRGALRLFRDALAARPSGALAEEARYGIAEAYRALGDTAAEGRALRDFVAAHPGAAMRPRAEARLRELERGLGSE